MRLRTIITAAAVPAVTAGLLLTTTAASSAAVASVASAPRTVHAVTYEYRVDDTTSVPTGKMDPTGNGPIWAYDNVKRIVTAVPDKAGNNTWDVTVATVGTYRAFANPITGKAWKGHDPFYGYVEYVVTAPAGVTPSAANLPKVTPSSYRSGGVLNELFKLPAGSTTLTHVSGGDDGQYNFLYFGIPGAPDGLYFQHS
jgi:hypothetical protein